MSNFDEELIKWSINPLADPGALISTFKQNRFKYLKKFDGTDTPIDFCKKVFLPNHLNWFLENENFIRQRDYSTKTKTTKAFFTNLLEATAELYKIQNEVKMLLEENKASDFYSDKKLIDKAVNLLKAINNYEVSRVGYNSQIRDYIDQKLLQFNLSQAELHTVLTPTFGTIYTFLAEEYLRNKNDISYIAKNYFANSIKDAETKFTKWKNFIDPVFIKNRDNRLTEIKLKKKNLYKKSNELIWIDGLITFDNLIDKLIVYSGILRHDTFLKLALFSNSGLSPEEVFRLEVYSPKER